MIKPIEKEIKGVTYNVTPFNVDEALFLAPTLLKLFGPPMIAFLGSGIKKGSNGAVDMSALKSDVIEKALISFCKELNSADLKTIVSGFSKANICFKDDTGNFKKIVDIPAHCAGDLGLYFKILYFIGEVNFKSFFSDLVE
jgi:hypothetical protein